MEEPEYNLAKENYHHVVLDGSRYDAGKQLAEVINQDPDAKKSSRSAKLDLKRLGFADWDTLQSSCEEYCPGITEEIQGFADGLCFSASC